MTKLFVNPDVFLSLSIESQHKLEERYEIHFDTKQTVLEDANRSR